MWRKRALIFRDDGISRAVLFGYVVKGRQQRKAPDLFVDSKGLSGSVVNVQYMVVHSNVSQHVLWDDSHFPTAPYEK